MGIKLEVDEVDVKEVIEILRDVQSYIFIQSRNDDLGNMIVSRIEKVMANIEEENE